MAAGRLTPTTASGEGPYWPWGRRQDWSYPVIRQVAADGERLEDPTVTGLENSVMATSQSKSFFNAF